MSKIKHKSYRKVLDIQNYTTKYGSETLKCKTVIWCLVNSLTSRTVKTNHIGMTVYVGSFKFSGVDARHPRKLASISLKNPLNSKVFKDLGFPHQRDIQDTFNHAYRQYIMGDDSRCKNLKGTVSWFSGDYGMITYMDQSFEVHACNIKGAKTWYAETACMYLKAGEEVTFNLADFHTHLSACKVGGNVYFDAEKWDKLDQSKLAFKCDENGKAINGLFE